MAKVRSIPEAFNMLAAECDEVVDWGIVAALDVGTEELAT